VFSMGTKGRMFGRICTGIFEASHAVAITAFVVVAIAALSNSTEYLIGLAEKICGIAYPAISMNVLILVFVSIGLVILFWLMAAYIYGIE